MNAIKLYINACRLAMQDDAFESKEFCNEVYQLLPTLRQSLSCTVCGKLLTEPYTPTETPCQHHVCKNCIGSKKQLKPSCSWCKNYETYVENSQIKLVIQCFIKLCAFMDKTGMFHSINKHLSNGGQCNINKILEEVLSKAITEDVKLSNMWIEEESIIKPVSPEVNLPEIVALNNTKPENDIPNKDCNKFVQTTEIDIKHEYDDLDIYVDSNNSVPLSSEFESINSNINLEKIDLFSPLKTEYVEPINSHLPCLSTNEEIIEELTPSYQTNTITHENKSATPDKKMDFIIRQSNYPDKLTTNLLKSAKPHINQEIRSFSRILKLDSKDNGINANIQIDPNSCSLIPSYTTIDNAVEPIGIYNSNPVSNSHQTISYMPHTNSATNSKVSRMFSIPSSAIFSGNTRQVVMDANGRLELPTNNLTYSVMSTDHDNTKIRFKRKPPDIENLINNSTETIKFPQNNFLRKSKPKRKGCRCGNATPKPGKLTCCGQRCPCYVAAKACIECQCKGCRNPHRPGGKKVRPVIPQFDNIKIHPVQQVCSQSPAVTQYQTNYSTSNISSHVYSQTLNSVCGIPNTIRTIHPVAGIGQLHAVSNGLHHYINLGSKIVDPTMNLANEDIAVKQINMNMSQMHNQFLINDNVHINNLNGEEEVDVL